MRFFRLLASIYGRPTTISRSSDVQLPSAVDREHTIEGVGGNASKQLIPGAPMFCLSIKLLDIFHEILETVYAGSKRKVNDSFRSGPVDEELLRKSLKLNHQLDQFLASTPERLGSFIANSSTNCDQACDLSLHEQALVTRLVPPALPDARLPFTTPQALTAIRFLYARIMLLRPLTLVRDNCYPTRSFHLEPAFNLESNVLRECRSLCLRSSELLVLSVRRDENSPRRLADWHTVYCNDLPAHPQFWCPANND